MTQNGHSADPLNNVAADARVLFENLSKVCHGFSADAVAQAALNMLINAVRQNRAQRADAEALYDELVSKGKHVLLEQHYGPTGARRGVYPFHQVIEAQPVRNLSKLRRV